MQALTKKNEIRLEPAIPPHVHRAIMESNEPEKAYNRYKQTEEVKNAKAMLAEIKHLLEINNQQAELFPYDIANSGITRVVELYLCCKNIVPHELAALILQHIFYLHISTATDPKRLKPETLQLKFKSWCLL